VGANYLVMELVEGQTLAASLAKGKLSIEETLRWGAQIADALAEAHAKGIAHRDLKPGNIMLAKSGVKLLDFGLAKLRIQGDETVTASNVIVGTPAYMAPEQRAGGETGLWTDIYALGLVLCEMATGTRPRPDEALRRDAMPRQLARIVEMCLAERDSRWESARDLKTALEMIAAESSQSAAVPRTNRRWLAGVLVAAGILAALAAGYWWRQSSSETPLRFSMVAPEGTSFLHVSQGGALALSPDGLRIAFVAEGAGGRLLWVRSLDGFTTRSLPGTEGATAPFWSADGRWIGFFAHGNLQKVDVDGGQAQFVAPVTPSANLSGSWNRKGEILYYNNEIPIGTVLRLTNASGGVPTQATYRNNDLLDENHFFPSFLPDGSHYLMLVRGGPELDVSLWLGKLGTNERRLLLKGTSNAHYAPPRRGVSGHLVFARKDKLMAQPFDVSKGMLYGTAVTVAEHVAVTATGSLADFSVSENGVLAYRTAEPASGEMAWFDRNGKLAGTIGDRPGNPRNNIRISPDGKFIAFTRQGAESQDVWIHDLVRDVASRLTFNGGRSPIWSPDGSQIAFVRGDSIDRMPVTGGAEAVIWQGPHLISVNDWSGDGKFLLFTRWDEKGVRQTWLLSDPLAGDSMSPPVRLANGIHAEFAPAIGAPRWVSFDRDQVSVRGLPGEAPGPWQVSVDFGNGSRFRRDGRELYFTSGQSFMAVDVEPGTPFRHGAPHVLFPLPRGIQAGQGQYAQGYDVTADGSRFIATYPAPDTPAATITILKNWQGTLGK